VAVFEDGVAGADFFQGDFVAEGNGVERFEGDGFVGFHYPASELLAGLGIFDDHDADGVGFVVNNEMSFHVSCPRDPSKKLTDGRFLSARLRGAIFQQAMDLGGGFAHFLAKNCLGQCSVFRADRLNQRAQVFQALTISLGGSIGVREAEAAPAPDAAVEHDEHGCERFTFGAFEEHFVEIVFGFEHGLGVAGVVGFFNRGEGAIEAGDLRVARLFGEEAGGESFEDGANSVDVTSFFDSEGANDWALVGDDRDEAFRFELAEGFADDGAGNAHHGDEFALDEAFTRIKTAGDDGLAEFVKDLATKGRGGLGNGREGRRGAK